MGYRRVMGDVVVVAVDEDLFHSCEYNIMHGSLSRGIWRRWDVRAI